MEHIKIFPLRIIRPEMRAASENPVIFVGQRITAEYKDIDPVNQKIIHIKQHFLRFQAVPASTEKFCHGIRRSILMGWGLEGAALKDFNAALDGDAAPIIITHTADWWAARVNESGNFKELF